MASKRVLSLFSIVMLNIIAVDSLRTLPIAAQYGTSLLFYYGIAAIFFLLPTVKVIATLSSVWPESGGIYIWVSRALGVRWGVMAVWLQWLYNIVWYPTILAFFASVLADGFANTLMLSKGALLSIILITFWCCTWVNCFGMRLSSWVSTVGAMLGTLLPMLLITVLGLIWFFSGKPCHIDMTWHAALPQTNWHTLAFFSNILFGLLGLEMSAAHAGEVRSPEKTYPKALRYSVVLILTTLVLASLSIAMVVPHGQLSLVNGLLEAFHAFFAAYHLEWMNQVMDICILVGIFSGVSAWVIGPAKGFWAAAQEGWVPAFFARVNRRGVPVRILCVQGLVLSALSLLYVFFDEVQSAYWFLSAMTAQLALIEYILLFLAYWVWCRTHSDSRLHWNVYYTTIAGVGICFLAIVAGLIPPTDWSGATGVLYVLSLLLGLGLFCGVPWFFVKRWQRAGERSW